MIDWSGEMEELSEEVVDQESRGAGLERRELRREGEWEKECRAVRRLGIKIKGLEGGRRGKEGGKERRKGN